MTYTGPLYVVPFGGWLILLGLLGLAILVGGALLVGLTPQRRAGGLVLLGGVLMLAGAGLGLLVATWWAPSS